MTKHRKTSDKTCKQARKDMRKEIVSAIHLKFQRATGYDPCELPSPCEVCQTWYDAIDAAKGVKA